MDFRHSDRSLAVQETLQGLLDQHVYPAEPVFERQAHRLRAAGTPFRTPAVLTELKTQARRQGLWNLFLPDAEHGGGLSVLDYAPVAELSGRSPALAPEAMNCAAPDTGNMELLHLFGTAEQQARWLDPLLDGRIRSCFAMTEPDVASSDATNISATADVVGDQIVLNGRKWWSTGAMRPECEISIVMAVTDPDGERHTRHSMVLVPMDSPGLTVERSTSVFGYDDGPHGGHGVIRYEDVRLPVSSILGTRGGGFAMAQARLGPGRIHHCMRCIGMAERALDLMCARASGRTAFGRPLAHQGVVREWIAQSRVRIEQARLLTLKAAWMIDTVGAKQARTEIAAIKVAAPRTASWVLDKAIQVHGGAGVSDDTPLAAMWAGLRTLRLADGPDEVHLLSIAREELRRASPREDSAAGRRSVR